MSLEFKFDKDTATLTLHNGNRTFPIKVNAQDLDFIVDFINQPSGNDKPNDKKILDDGSVYSLYKTYPGPNDLAAPVAPIEDKVDTTFANVKAMAALLLKRE